MKDASVKMNRILLMSIVILTTMVSSCQQSAKKHEEIEKDNMYVKGRTLYTAANEEVVLRGVNEMIVWHSDPTGKYILPEIAKTGANSMRLVWTTEGDPKQLDELITNCLANEMIPMVELHDATGDWDKLPMLIDYWKREDVKQVMDKHKKWVILNIANEVGSYSTDSLFIANYKMAIIELRDIGYTVPFVIDASDWGKDEKQIVRTWKEILDEDPLTNTMFSVHTYWVDTMAVQRLDDFVGQVVSDTIPFLFGEGPQPNGWDCTTDFPYQHCMKLCEENGIGWLTWSWGAVNNGDCGEKSAFDITEDGIYGNWNNEWGELVAVKDVNSIQRTSVRPASLLAISKSEEATD